MSLTPEERRRIYEEEKARIEAQARLQRERTTPLENAIESYLRDGFRVLSRTDTTAQLVKPRRYNPAFGCLGFLTFGVFWVLGLLDFLLQKDRLVYLSLDANGAVLVDNKTTTGIAQERSDMIKGWVIIGVILVLIIVAFSAFGQSKQTFFSHSGFLSPSLTLPPESPQGSFSRRGVMAALGHHPFVRLMYSSHFRNPSQMSP